MTEPDLVWKAALGTKKKVVPKAHLAALAHRMALNEDSVIRTLTRNNRIIPLFKGYYYLRDPEEIMLHRGVSPFEIFSYGARAKKIGNWYYGLYTALRLNGMTHEHRNDEYVISDGFYRPRGIVMSGKRFVILKWRSELGRFGLKKINNYWVSDPEKTVLDFVFWDHYRVAKGHRATEVWKDHIDSLDSKRITVYLEHYQRKIQSIMEYAL